uniref:Secreted protein n=1 Tax=Steinernema glaseri TaxID=37863 RepID=A0A1I8AFW0_9BILA
MLVSRIIPRTLRCARSVATATHSSVEAATPTLEQQLGPSCLLNSGLCILYSEWMQIAFCLLGGSSSILPWRGVLLL